MALDANIILQGRGVDIPGSLARGLGLAQAGNQLLQQRQQAPLRNQLLQQKVGAGEQLATQRSAQNRQSVQTEIATGFRAMKQFLDRGDLSGAANIIDQLGLSPQVAEKLKGGFLDRNGIPETVETLKSEIDAGLAALSPQGEQKSVRQREFETLTRGFPEDEIEEAKRIRLGLSPRAVGAAAGTVMIGGVPHIFDRVEQKFIPAEVEGEKVTAQTVSDNRVQIESNIVTARENAKNSAGIVKDGFQSILGINKNIRNIDKAIDALNRDARTGVINSFLPSIRAASIELDQIRNELALDVVGATTFGALSAGELALAQQVALPLKLSPEKLKEHLINRRNAQMKLSEYFNEQIKFLGGKDERGIPNTINGFIEMKEREKENRERGQGQTQRNVNVGDELNEGDVISNGKQTFRVVNGQLEEVR